MESRKLESLDIIFEPITPGANNSQEQSKISGNAVPVCRILPATASD